MPDETYMRKARAKEVARAYELLQGEPSSDAPLYLKEINRSNPEALIVQLLIKAAERIADLEARLDGMQDAVLEDAE
jgi:hypothetical protein